MPVRCQHSSVLFAIGYTQIVNFVKPLSFYVLLWTAVIWKRNYGNCQFTSPMRLLLLLYGLFSSIFVFHLLIAGAVSVVGGSVIVDNTPAVTNTVPFIGWVVFVRSWARVAAKKFPKVFPKNFSLFQSQTGSSYGLMISHKIILARLTKHPNQFNSFRFNFIVKHSALKTSRILHWAWQSFNRTAQAIQQTPIQRC